MSTKRQRSNRDADDRKRQGQNTHGQSRKPGSAHARAARAVPNHGGDADIPIKNPNHRQGVSKGNA